jgi:[ribosomal protein S18]-alanine N-acetyltransferase
LAALDRIAFDSPWSEDAFAAELPLAHSRTLVARDEDSAGTATGYPVGYLVYHRVADEMQILRIAVAPQFRRRGLARILLLRGIKIGINGFGRIGRMVFSGRP